MRITRLEVVLTLFILLAIGGGFGIWLSQRPSADMLSLQATAAGKLVGKFGTKGVQTINFQGNESPYLAAAQSGTQTILLGVNYIDSEEAVITRINANGTIDKKFGKSGRVIDDFVTKDTQQTFLHTMAIQPDGKILLAGGLGEQEGDAIDFDTIVVRLDKNGVLDKTFGQNGVMRNDLGGDEQISMQSLMVLKDGSILAAGSKDDGDFERDFLMMNYTKRGKLNQKFGTKGVVTTDLGGDDVVEGLSILADGSIQLVGTQGRDETVETDTGTSTSRVLRLALARYTAKGQLNKKLNKLGKYLGTSLPANHFPLVRTHADRSITVLLNKNDFQCDEDFQCTNDRELTQVLRYTQDGKALASFGVKGQVAGTVFKQANFIGGDVTYDAKKNLLIGGTLEKDTGDRMAIFRLTPKGKLDPSFGAKGQATAALSSKDIGLQALTLLPDGILGFGAANPIADSIGASDFVLAKFTK